MCNLYIYFMPINRCPSVVRMYLQQDVNHTVYMILIASAVCRWERPTGCCICLCFQKKGSQLLDFQWISIQSSARSLCKNICSCQATGYSACLLAATPIFHHWKQKTGHHSDLVGLSTPLFPHPPLFIFYFFGTVVCSLPSLCSQEESDQSLQLSWALEVRLSGSPPLWETG